MRIENRFAALRREGRAGLVTFVMAGDPDYDTAAKIMAGLPGAGADLIEIGMPFTDPMADGPAIQASGLRALKAGQTMVKTLSLVRDFRAKDTTTPVVLMGYYNPIYIYGVERFLADAMAAGVDGLIIVDLPPEEDAELCLPALKAGLNFIRLATPTTDDHRLPKVLTNTSGFVYYVSVTGITGTKAPDIARVTEAVARIKRHTDLPVAVGFGVRTAEQARADCRRRRRGGGGHRPWWKRSVPVSMKAATLPPARRTRYCHWSRSWRAACAPRPERRPSETRRWELQRLNWIKNFVRPKIRSILGGKREVPENMWVKCPETGQMVFYRDLEANQFVIPASGYHMRMAPDVRLKHMFDDGQYALIEMPEVAADPLKFRDERRYSERLKEARSKSGQAMR